MRRFVWVGLMVVGGCFKPAQESTAPPSTFDAGARPNVIGPAGGELDAGLVLVVPPGALLEQVSFGLEQIAPPPGVPGTPVSGAWRAGPSGLRFLTPARLGLPIQASGGVVVLTAPTELGPFQPLDTTVAGNLAWAQVNHFSVFIAVIDGGADAGAPDAGDAGENDDAGLDDGGEDAGAPFDAGSVCPTIPGWVDAGQPPAAMDAGACSNVFVDVYDTEAWLTRTCLGGSQQLQCTWPYCTCQSADDSSSSMFSFLQPVSPLTDEVVRALWQCECGFPPLTTDPPLCASTFDGGTSGPFSKPTGAICSDGTECEYGLCMVFTSWGPFCSASCHIGACPCGFRCTSISAGGGESVCVPY